MRLISGLMLLSTCIACAHSLIPGTQVRDTKANREVYDTLRQLQEALVAKNTNAAIALAAPEYFETMATPDQNDDYGYAELRDKVLPDLFAVTGEMQLTFEVYEIETKDDRAHADVRYHARAHMKLASGSQWATGKDFHRIELVRRDGAWRILSGL